MPNFKDKLLDLWDIVSTILVHAILMICIAVIGEGVRFTIEKITHKEIDKIDNDALVFIYNQSEYLTVILFFILVVFDITEYLIKKMRKLKE